MQPGQPGPEDPYAQQPQHGQFPPPPPPPSFGQQPGGYGGAAAPNNTLGLVSMILGIAAIPLVCCFYLGIPVGIAAIVTGFLGKKKADEGQATNRSQAMTGLICGAVAAVLGIGLIIAVVALNVQLPATTTTPGD